MRFGLGLGERRRVYEVEWEVQRVVVCIVSSVFEVVCCGSLIRADQGQTLQESSRHLQNQT